MQDDEVNECQKCDEYLAGWKRAQADYANLKKDIEKKKGEMAIFAMEQSVIRGLPVLDNLTSALEHIPELTSLQETERKQIQAWMDGIKAIKDNLEQSLEDIGLASIDVSGTFDPQIHEAVGTGEDASKPQDTILQVIRRGWMLNGNIIRPAQVIVNQVPSQT